MLIIHRCDNSFFGEQGAVIGAYPQLNPDLLFTRKNSSRIN